MVDTEATMPSDVISHEGEFIETRDNSMGIPYVKSKFSDSESTNDHSIENENHLSKSDLGEYSSP